MKLPPKYQQFVRDMKAADDEGNWDRRNPATGDMYCIHGVNLGTWDGPDYMCGACENGTTLYEYALGCAWESWRRDRYAAHRRIQEYVLDLFKGESGVEMITLFSKEEWSGVLTLAPEQCVWPTGRWSTTTETSGSRSSGTVRRAVRSSTARGCGSCTPRPASRREMRFDRNNPFCPVHATPLRFNGFYAAPGSGREWECAVGPHHWSEVSGWLFEPDSQAHLPEIEQFR